jgi:hypothetical protein
MNSGYLANFAIYSHDTVLRRLTDSTNFVYYSQSVFIFENFLLLLLFSSAFDSTDLSLEKTFF